MHFALVWLAARAWSASPGDVVPLESLRLSELSPLPVVQQASGDTRLLLSDSPETFPKNGIALRETIEPGRPARLYLYHVPAPGGKKTISTAIENLGSSPLTVSYRRFCSPGPGGNYHGKALQALRQLLGPEGEFELHLPPGGRAPLDDELDASQEEVGALAHAIYEFSVDQPARVTVFERDGGEPLSAVDSFDAVLAPGKGAGRGAFPAGDIEVANSSAYLLDAAKGARLTLADGRAEILQPDGTYSSWLKTREGGLDKGNYGAVYHVRLRWKSSDGRGLDLYAYNPDGPAAVCRRQGNAFRFGSELVLAPRGQDTFDGEKQAVFLRRLSPAAPGEVQTLSFEFTPPGASCSSTGFAFVPAP